MNNAIKIVLASALITAAVIKGAPALAEPAGGEPNIAVRLVETYDLDLSTTAGQRQLDIRLAQAAREVCGAASDSDLASKNAVRQCRDDVLTDARAKRDQLLTDRTVTIAVTSSR